MGEEESTKVVVEGVAGTAAHPPPAEGVKDLAKDKSAVPPPAEEEKPDDSKTLATVNTTEAAATERTSGGSIDRDAVLARVETEKRESMIKAWEENEKTKAQNNTGLDRIVEIGHDTLENYDHHGCTISICLIYLPIWDRAAKKMASITAWENSKKAAVEAELRMKEEALEKKKAEYVEKMKNKIAMLHKAAEEKKAMVEAKRGEEFLKAEEMAAKYRVTGFTPKKLFGCFGA
ncbi:Remorin family [Musa troglodytarum]|uniref:Remorin family n=1 Tax=Musa troglodytarum TaxID=320322 RepID=A0A9E7EL22_9LILI|nr:Remorin family [Musa troglodytarum]